eukprot:g16719.t1
MVPEDKHPTSSPSTGSPSELHRAASQGSVDDTLALLGDGSTNINEGDSKGDSPLIAAAIHGHEGVARALLDKGASVSAANHLGLTALHFAAQHGHLAVTELLVVAGADLNAVHYQGGTPIHGGAIGGHLRVVQILIEAGANVNNTLVDSRVPPPLFLAALFGHVQVVRELLRASADPLLVNTDLEFVHARLPLDAAAAKGHSDVVRELIQQLLLGAGADTTYSVPGMGAEGEVTWKQTPLGLIDQLINLAKMGNKKTFEERHLRALEAKRRLMMRAEAVRAASWLWQRDVPRMVYAPDSEGKTEAAPTIGAQLRMMLPLVRRRSRRRGVLLKALFRYSSYP